MLHIETNCGLSLVKTKTCKFSGCGYEHKYPQVIKHYENELNRALSAHQSGVRSYDKSHSAIPVNSKFSDGCDELQGVSDSEGLYPQQWSKSNRGCLPFKAETAT